MASVLSAAAILPWASTTVIPKFKEALLYPPRNKNPNFIGPFIVLQASSTNFHHNHPYVVCFKFMANAGSDSINNVNFDDDNVVDSGVIQGDCIEIEKTGKNSRRIRSKVAVKASLEILWNILTDYEKLADFIPGLAVSQLLEKRENFARLFQIGEQNLAFGLKFNAKGTIDCFEKELQTLPSGQRRDIEFKMVEGDFQLFEGKWSIEQEMKCGTGDSQSDSYVAQEFQTTLAYVVDVKPKMWLPVRLVEGRLCREIRTNLSCIREVAEKAFQNPNTV